MACDESQIASGTTHLGGLSSTRQSHSRQAVQRLGSARSHSAKSRQVASSGPLARAPGGWGRNRNEEACEARRPTQLLADRGRSKIEFHDESSWVSMVPEIDLTRTFYGSLRQAFSVRLARNDRARIRSSAVSMRRGGSFDSLVTIEIPVSKNRNCSRFSTNSSMLGGQTRY